MSIQRKAVALISGGLDSMLATQLMLEQGIHVEGLNFYTGFCHSGHTSAIRTNNKKKPKRNDALWVAEQLGIKLHIVDIVEAYRDIVINPRYGYGAHMNPCLDCKIFMVKKAKDWMVEHGFDFIITGEVVGQRPKSQRKAAMPIVSNRSGAEDRLLRPLCALTLPPTKPEREGWVDRQLLKGFNGRGRKGQIALAKASGIEEYAQPSGGCCVLTDASYSRKLQDLWEVRNDKHYTLDDIILLKVGRHIRPRQHFKVILGREESENKFLTGFRHQFTYLTAVDHAGSFALLEGDTTADDLELAARITARFCQGRQEDTVKISVTTVTGDEKILQVVPLPEAELAKEWYV